ncbi:MAG TPA: hypothetical protein PLM79_06285 [Syntrophobacteraceae bacterium]|nr:hypothetical protein [Syntrophobacteraceae bacterium]
MRLKNRLTEFLARFLLIVVTSSTDMLRSMTCFRFPDWIRVTISRQEAMEAFVEALAGIIRE